MQLSNSWPLIAVLAFVGCTDLQTAGLARPIPIEKGDDFVHPASGMVLPDRVGAFRRLQLTGYDAQSLDVGAAYSRPLPDGLMAATVYIAPGPAEVAERAPGCDAKFSARKTELLARYERAEEVTESGPAPAAGEAPGSGRILSFAFNGTFEGRPVRIRSEYRLYCVAGGAWFIEYRFNSPPHADEVAEIERFVIGVPTNLPRGP